MWNICITCHTYFRNFLSLFNLLSFFYIRTIKFEMIISWRFFNWNKIRKVPICRARTAYCWVIFNKCYYSIGCCEYRKWYLFRAVLLSKVFDPFRHHLEFKGLIFKIFLNYIYYYSNYKIRDHLKRSEFNSE